MTDYNKLTKKEIKQEKDTRPRYFVNYPKMLNFREEPGGNIIMHLKSKEKMVFLGTEDEYDGVKWLKMEARGKQGWVMARYVEMV